MNFRFDDFVIRQAALQASLLIPTAGFRRDDWEDLRQEMILDCFRRSPKFDPARGDWRGFVCGVIRNHATVLVMRRRKRALEVFAADLIKAKGVGSEDPLDILDTRPHPELADLLHLSLDVRRVVDGLPDQLRSVAVLLSHMSVKEVCQRTGKSRSRVYQMIRQMRTAFVRAGFQTNPSCKATVSRHERREARALRENRLFSERRCVVAGSISDDVTGPLGVIESAAPRLGGGTG